LVNDLYYDRVSSDYSIPKIRQGFVGEFVEYVEVPVDLKSNAQMEETVKQGDCRRLIDYVMRLSNYRHDCRSTHSLSLPNCLSNRLIFVNSM
jgi:hypothetical protein